MVTRTTVCLPVLDAPDDLLLPDVVDLAGAEGTVEVVQHALDDSYLDTTDGDLAAGGVSLRRRSGPVEEGWLLRLPAGTMPPELASPGAGANPPPALLAAALGLTRGGTVRPVVEVSTQRTVTRLADPDGEVLAEVVDERASSTTLGDVSRLDHWRTVTVRPGHDPRAASTVVTRLREAGARPADARGPLERALGLRVWPPVARAESLADLLGRHVAEQCDQIAAGDLALRLGEPRVHRTRVAVRRLRSTLRTFADLLDPEPTQRLEDELVWWAGLLGEVRDREVLSDRITAQLSALPPELVLGPVAADVDATLAGERAERLQQVESELEGERLLALLETLLRWRTEPPFLEGASAPAEDVRPYVRAASQTARRRLRQAAREVPGPEQEERLHRARKAAKRARYAAEIAEPVWPRARRHVRRAEKLQTLLGEHQDSVVTAAFLLRAGAASGGEQGRNGFTYGLLLAGERERAARIRRKVRRRRR